MSSDPIIRLRDVGKSYPIYQKPHHRLMQMFNPRPGKWCREFTALRDVTLEVGRGETVGVVGRNGSGKSTMLQIVCGTLPPSAGSLQVHGRIAALLELGAGFNPEFTGRENVFLNASILGLPQREIEERIGPILEFADIGDFIDQPVKTYSSGMYVRLAFSVAINVEPDILVVDEALAVGDEGFQRKCYARIDAMRERGTTILFVSHSAGIVVDLCDRAILLDQGELIAEGTPKHVVSQYQRMLHAPQERSAHVREQIKAMHRVRPPPGQQTTRASRGAAAEPGDTPQQLEAYWLDGLVPQQPVAYESRGADLEDPHLQTLDGRRVNVLVQGEQYVYAYRITLRATCIGVRCGMMIRTVTGIDLGGAVSSTGQSDLAVLEAGTAIDVRIRFRCLLASGTYFLNSGIVARFGDGEQFVNRWVDVAMFKVMAMSGSVATGLVDFDVVPQARVAQ